MILAVTGFSYQSENVYPLSKIILPVIGILICVLWYVSEKREIEKAVLWIYTAKEIEVMYFQSIFDILNRGAKFSKGEPVEFQIGKAIVERQLKWPFRKFRGQATLIAIILLFFLMQVYILAIEIIL